MPSLSLSAFLTISMLYPNVINVPVLKRLQEEHRRWHAEPPYMGQKIRIENGQPIIIDRKERASLTPIGSLAAWGGSSGGMVVKVLMFSF